MSTDSRSAGLDELVLRTEGFQPWRRLFHLVGGSCVAGIVFAMAPHSPSTRWLFGGALTVTFAVDALRVRSDALNGFFFRWCGALLSPREAGGLSLTWFLLGVFLVLWFPGEIVAVASILVLAVADPAANTVGHFLGRRPLGKGTLEGSAAFFIPAAVVLIPLVGLQAAVPVAAVVAAVEVLPIRLDDNATIPLATAACLWALAP